MNPPFLKREDLGEVEYLSTTSSGVVFSVRSLATSFSDGLLYKEFSEEATERLDVPALASMPALLESLNRDLGLKLLSNVAWPTRLVAGQNGICGYVRPTPPRRFYWVSKESSLTRGLATVDSLVRADSKTSTTEDVLLRYEILAKVARTMTLLHDLGVVVGRIAPVSILYTPGPQVEVFLADAEWMHVSGKVPLPPGKGAVYLSPPNNEKVVTASDVYLLGLLASQLLEPVANRLGVAGSFTLPHAVKDIIASSLVNSPELRPTAHAWCSALTRAKDQTRRARTSPGQGAARKVRTNRRDRMPGKAGSAWAGLLGLLILVGIGGLVFSRNYNPGSADYTATYRTQRGIESRSRSGGQLTEPRAVLGPSSSAGDPGPTPTGPSIDALEAAGCVSLISLRAEGLSKLLNDLGQSGATISANITRVVSADIESARRTPNALGCENNEYHRGICDGVLNYGYDNAASQFAAIVATVDACRGAWETSGPLGDSPVGLATPNAGGWPICHLIERLDFEGEDDVAVAAFSLSGAPTFQQSSVASFKRQQRSLKHKHAA